MRKVIGIVVCVLLITVIFGQLQALLNDHVERLLAERLELGVLQELFDIQILVENELNIPKINQILGHNHPPFSRKAKPIAPPARILEQMRPPGKKNASFREKRDRRPNAEAD